MQMAPPAAVGNEADSVQLFNNTAGMCLGMVSIVDEDNIVLSQDKGGLPLIHLRVLLLPVAPQCLS
jgi:hypothetical protein